MNSIEVVKDGKTYTVHEPKAKDSAWVMAAMLPMVALRQGDDSVSITEAIEKCLGDEGAVDGFIRVVAACADLPVEEVSELGMSSLYAMLGSALTLVEMSDTPLAPGTAASSKGMSGRQVKK